MRYRAFWFTMSLVVLLYGTAFWRQTFGFAIADEIDFLAPLESWVLKGPQRWGLWHAPFYPWLIMMLGKITGGVSIGWSRAIGGISILAAALLQQICCRSWPFVARVMMFVTALLSPVALGSSLLLDYDNTLLVATTALFFTGVFAFEYPSWKRTIILGLFMGLCLMSKETTPLIYPLAPFISWARHRTLGAALGWAIAIGIIGCLVFLTSTSLWCFVYDLPLSSVFEMDLLGLKIKGLSAQPSIWQVELWGKVHPMFWLGLPMTVLFLWRLPRLFKQGGPRAGIAGAVIAVIFVYTFLLKQRTYHFPKYMAPVLIWVPWLAAASDEIWARSVQPWLRSKVAIWAIVPVLIYVLGPDPLWLVYERSANAFFKSQITLVLSLALGLGLYFFGARKNLWQWSTYVSMWVLTLSVALSLAYTKTALTQNHAIHYWYGERAMEEARDLAQRWRQEHPNGMIVSTAKDLVYALRPWQAQYIPKDFFVGQRVKWCQSKQDILIITRIREDSSLLQAPLDTALSGCWIQYGEGSRDVIAGNIVAQ